MNNIKPVLQQDIKDCGVCSMLYIIKHYGGYISLEKLREDTLTDINGTNAYQIVNAFKKYGFDSYGIYDKNISSEINYPCIVHLILKNGYQHFVVLKKIKNNFAYIMDPAKGNDKIKLQDFLEIFSGNIIMVYPRGNIVSFPKEKSIYKLFYDILRKEYKIIIKIIFISIFIILFTVLSSYYLKLSYTLSNYNKNIIKYFILIFLIIIILKIIFEYIRAYYENYLSNKIDVKVYSKFIIHILNLPLKNIKSRTTGEVLTRINELSEIKSLFCDIFISCSLDSLLMIISLFILFFINKNLFTILIGVLFIYSLFGILISKIIYKKILENITLETDFNSFLGETIDMFESIKNLNVSKYFSYKNENLLSNYLYSSYRFKNMFNLLTTIKNFIIEFGIFIINSFGLILIIKSNMNIVDLFTFNILLSYCINPVKNIIDMLPKYNYIKASFTKLSEFINIDEESIKYDNKKLKGDIIFKNVSFSYNKYDYILKNINFIIREGEHVLIDGVSGCGKSTICKLIYKNYDDINGNIYINDQNLKDLDNYLIKNNILYVCQNEKLFTASFRENILLDRNIDDFLFNSIIKACKVDEIIDKKKMRYESLIETSSCNLSGGEKQRIILARGLMKNANIIILDEALSEVPFKLEKEIIKNIRELFKDKTIIYISHKNQKNSFDKVINVGEINEIL